MSKPFNLLLVDDDNLVCELVEFAISDIKADINLQIAHNCAEAASQIAELRPDLAILDINLPDGDGRDIARSLGEHNDGGSSIPVIFLTGRDDDISRIESYKTDAIDYVTKPFSVFQLGLKLKNLIALLSRQSAPEVDGAYDLPPARDKKAVFFHRFLEICERNCSEPEFNIQSAAKLLNLSTRTLQRQLKTEFDTTFSEQLKDIRMNKARTMLSKNYPAKEVAGACGYRYVENFNAAFHREHDQTPKNFKLAERSNEAQD